MRALIVYESMFGNTAEIAEAIAQGLRRHCDVDVARVDDPIPALARVDLLVVGGPTHAFGLSRPRTRRDAAERPGGAAGTGADTGVREWLDTAAGFRPRTHAAAFGTKVGKPSWLPGSAARGIGRKLRRRGFALAAGPVDFYVEGTPGPLGPAELDRAREWGIRLGRTESEPFASRS